MRMTERKEKGLYPALGPLSVTNEFDGAAHTFPAKTSLLFPAYLQALCRREVPMPVCLCFFECIYMTCVLDKAMLASCMCVLCVFFFFFFGLCVGAGLVAIESCTTVGALLKKKQQGS